MNKKTKDTIIIILFLAPAVFLFLGLIIYPVFDTIFLSFHSWKGIYGSPLKFVGLQNFITVLKSESFYKALLNSFCFLVGGFLILMPLSFLLALLITSKLRYTKLMKASFFMPIMLSTTAIALMWVYILNPTFGAVNVILRAVGLDFLAKEWLSTPGLNVWAIVLVNEWTAAGYNMLIFAAGLISIPNSIYESAEIDGCIGLKKLLYISIPLSKESFKIFSILCITGCLKVFDLVWAMTKGGPNRTSETPATLLYNEAFTFKSFGTSSAIGVILLLLGILFSLLLTKTLFKREQY